MTAFALGRLLRVGWFPTLLAWIAHIPIRPRKDGIGQVDATVGRIDPHVIRSVQQLALVVVDQHLVASIRADLPQFSVHVGSSDEVSFTVEDHAVRTTSALQEQSDLAGASVPTINLVVGLVREEHIAMPIRRGALGETEAFRETDQLPVP